MRLSAGHAEVDDLQSRAIIIACGLRRPIAVLAGWDHLQNRVRPVAAHAVLAIVADAVEDRQDLGLEVSHIEPLADISRAKLERPRVASRALAISRCRSAVFADRKSSRRPFSIAALATRAGWLWISWSAFSQTPPCLLTRELLTTPSNRRSSVSLGSEAIRSRSAICMAGAESSSALRRTDSAIFAFGSIASLTAAERTLGSLSPNPPSMAR